MCFHAGFGCFTLLDAADPNNPSNKATGLLRLNPSEAVTYVVPSTFAVDGITDAAAGANTALRLWGQATRLKVSKFEVTFD